jgi:hypothetical protein
MAAIACSRTPKAMLRPAWSLADMSPTPFMCVPLLSARSALPPRKFGRAAASALIVAWLALRVATLSPGL